MVNSPHAPAEQALDDLAAFLDCVVPRGEGHICTASKPTGGKMRHRFSPRTPEGLTQAAEYVRQAAAGEADAYHACALYRDPTRRTQENVVALKCFWIDIDVRREGDGKAAGKVLADQPAALAWIKDFVAATGLPNPNLIVKSGYGLHVYWVLEDAMTAAEWQPYANALKAALVAHKATLDAGLSADSARLLRPPETYNFKDPQHPAPVTVLGQRADYPNELVFKALRPFLKSTTAASADVLQFPAPSQVFANRKSTLNEAAKAGALPDFKDLPDDQKNAVVRGITTDPRFIPLADRDGDTWRDHMWAGAHAAQLGATEAKEALREWSMTSPQYDAAVFESVWRRFDPNKKITVGTLLKAATKVGIDWRQLASAAHYGSGGAASGAADTGDGASNARGAAGSWRDGLMRSDKGRVFPTLANAITALRSAPEFKGALAYNELARKVTIRGPLPWGSRDEFWSDDDSARAAEWLQRKGITVNPETAGLAAAMVAKEQPFHPTRQYFDGLVWDGTPRLPAWTHYYLGSPNDPYHRAVGEKVLIAPVARTYRPGCKADNIPILEGVQGLLKSTAIRTLASDPWFTDDVHDLGSKDAAMQIRGVLIAELPELSAMSRAEVERVKGFVSRQVDHFRPPYGREVVDQPRQCVLWGTSNKTDYLRDETGGRRFWPIRCTRIDIAGLSAARDQLWAEAVHRYRAGEHWWLEDPRIVEAARIEQDARYQSDPWQGPITAFVAGKSSVTVEEILAGVLLKQRDAWHRGDEMRIASCFRHLGWERARITRVPGADREWCYVEPGHPNHPHTAARRKARRAAKAGKRRRG